MPPTLYEIVELANGDVVLQREDGEGGSLVRISFSKEALQFMREGKFNVTKAMIEAGMEAARELGEVSTVNADLADERITHNDDLKTLH